MKPLAFIFIIFITVPAYSQISEKDPEEIIAQYNLTKKDTFVYFNTPDTNISQYKLPPSFIKPTKWVEADAKRGKGAIFYNNDYPKTYHLKQALDDLTHKKDFGTVQCVKTWSIDHYQESFPYLISLLSNKQKVGLTNTADLIIWDRLGTGDLQFYGHGGGMAEDLFTVAGRASWILNEITGEGFAVVHGNLTEMQAQEFKQMWMDYIRRNSK